MTDIIKRNTLKALVTTAAAFVAAPSASANNIITSANKIINRSGTTGQNDSTPTLSIMSQLSANELEVVITNHGTTRTTITDISPSRIVLAKGDIYLKGLVNNGEFSIEPGQHITVPLTRRSTARNTALDHSVASLNDVLKNNVSLATRGQEENRIKFS